MGSIPPGEALARELERVIERTASNAAFKERNPWALSKLREAGRGGITTAYHERKEATWGLSFPEYAKECVRRAIWQAARTLSKKLSSPESIEEALRTFSVSQWEVLIEEFEKQDLEPLRSYMEAHRDELVRDLGRGKVESVLVDAIERGLRLSLRGARLIPVTHPMWAAIWRQHSWQRKMEGAPRPSERRSWDEMGSDRAIAEGLSQRGSAAYGKQIKTYFERMEQVPFEQYEGHLLDYFAMIADTRAYKRYLHSQGLD